MYPIERYLCRIKSYVRNKSHLEGSIAEGYLVKECLTFCSRYLNNGVETRLNRATRNYDGINGLEGTPKLFANVGHPLGGKKNGNTFTLECNYIRM